MACKSCHKTLFPGELAIHFPGGMEALHKGQLLLFPQVLVCLTCGFSEFSLPEADLRRLIYGSGGRSKSD
jgi:hypothetical protein